MAPKSNEASRVFSSDAVGTIALSAWGQKGVWPLTHTIHENQFCVDCRSKYERHNNKTSRKHFKRMSLWLWYRDLKTSTQKGLTIKEMCAKFYYINIKNLCSSKDTLKWTKRHTTEQNLQYSQNI